MSSVHTHTSHSPEETAKLAMKFAEHLKAEEGRATLVCLYGDLGAGKTTFTKALAKVLGITDIVTSPTFVIEKVYNIDTKGFKKFIHIDAYRLKEGSELLAIGWNDIITHPENLILIEWPSYVADVLPNERINIRFTHVDENTRTVEVTKHWHD